MKKSLLTVLMVVYGMVAAAQSYGILVNGKMYFAGEPAGEFEGFQQYLAHVSVKSGDYCQLFDYIHDASWAVDLNSYSEKGFTRDGNKYNVTVDGCFDFYIKLKYEQDELYIGPGSNCGEGVDISGGKPVIYTGSAPAQCPDVMFQCFYWNSYQDQGYGRTKWMDMVNGNGYTSAAEIGQWFDLVWLPPMSKSTGGTGYLPVCYNRLDSDWGTKTNLVSEIAILHQNGAKVVADIVVNHAASSQGWCKFSTMDFGAYGTFEPQASWICQTDEMNYNPEAGDCQGKATGAHDDGYGDEANYDSGRDWDHNNAEVRKMFKAYETWLRKEIKIDGFRYDYCKGFHNSHINEYNAASEAYFSVMEYWDGNVQTLQDRLNDAGWNTCTFDFATKYTAFNQGIASGDYGKLKGAGLLGAGKARYAVTFLDSHDSFQRDDNEFCGHGNSMKYPGKIQQCYAYLLSMPGIPCVFYPHWAKFKEQLKPMINARYKTGVHSESAVEDETGNGYYKATIKGTNGEIRLLLGPNSGYNSTPSGFTKAITGENYGVYYRENSPRGDKNKNRQPQGIGAVQRDEVPSTKFIKDGKLYIRCGEQVYDVQGNRIQ